MGRRARSRRGRRLPERAGDGARADRDDQLHDGLRHDRRRARLLARQVEEARRRRRDHDREQDGADGARQARLRADGDGGDRRVHRRAQHDGRRAVPQDRALPGLRLRRWRPRDPLHGSREDDGRRPAVHLGRDLEDGQPPRGDDGRGDLAALDRGVAARRQGDRDLPRQLQGRAAALGQERQGRAAAGRGRRARAADEAPPPAGRPQRGRPQVPRRRIRGLRAHRPLRRRLAGRHLRRHREGRHDDGRPDELALHRGLDGPAVRRPAGGLRLEALAHALRAERPHERRRHPRREVDRGLHLPLVRQEVPDARAAGGGGDPLGGGQGEARVGVRKRRRRAACLAGRGTRPRARRPSSTRGRTPSSAPAAAGAWCERAAATRAATAARTRAAASSRLDEPYSAARRALPRFEPMPTCLRFLQ